MENLILQMIRDLEDTRTIYHGYAYVRTMRNILVAKEGAIIAPFFTSKPYYGVLSSLSMRHLEYLLDNMVNEGRIDVVITDRGKRYLSAAT